jgi:hypothetical protein
MRDERLLVGGKKWRARERAQIRREEIMPKPRQGALARLHRPARLVGPLDDRDLPALVGEMDRRREPVETSTLGVPSGCMLLKLQRTCFVVTCPPLRLALGRIPIAKMRLMGPSLVFDRGGPSSENPSVYSARAGNRGSHCNRSGYRCRLRRGRRADAAQVNCYSLAVRAWRLTFDYQFVNNPAYNRDRGPVSVLGPRLHAEF